MVTTAELALAMVDLPLEAMLTGSRVGTRLVAGPGTIYLCAARQSRHVLAHRAPPHALCLHGQAYHCRLLLRALLPQQ